MKNIILAFNNISVRRLNLSIFDSVNFEIKKGENWALVGANGSGKSLFLDIIAGKASVSNGTVEFPYFENYNADNKIDEPLFKRHKIIAYIKSRHSFRSLSNTNDLYYQQRFNSADSENVITVYEYLTSLKAYNLSTFWPLEKVIERLRLTALQDKQLIKLSNGETKRLLLAAALIKNPAILLLDNPLTGLDLNSRSDFNDLLNEITQSGITVIIATSPFEIPEAITHVALLESGKIKAQFARDDFNGADLKFTTQNRIHEEELKALLSLTANQSYQTVIGMENINIRYGDKIILDKVNWEVKQGERWALLGHNGAGKSTLLSLVNGDNPQAYANKITLFDRKRGTGESIWDIKKKIGFVSPEFFQYFPMESSCIEVIESGFYDTLGLFRRSDTINRNVAVRWTKLLGIDSLCNKLFKDVSASNQRLCLLARALVKNPPLLIFDEPCQGLDNSQQEQFKYLVDEICKQSNVTLVYVSHYQHEIPNSITHTIALAAGKVVNDQ